MAAQGRGGGAEGQVRMARVNHDIEHDSAGGEGQDRAGRARTLSGVGGPLELSFPLMRLGGLRVRAHWIVPLYAVCELVACLPRKYPALPIVAGIVGSLIVLSILREAVRGLMARRLGSRLGGVTVWPLGGLNSTATAGVVRPVICEAGGLVVGAVLGVVLGLALWQTGSTWAQLIFDPFRPQDVIGGDWPLWRVLLWSAYYANAVVLVLNLTLPMYPFDLGRIVAARMRGRGESTADERAARVGMFCAVALLVAAATRGETRLMGVAAFGFLVSYVESRRAPFLIREGPNEPERAEELAREGTRPSRGLKVLVPESDVDRLLEKISREGLPSLTVEEREVLSRETERRRRG